MSIKGGAVVIFILFLLIPNECRDKELSCCPAYFPWPSPGAVPGAAELGHVWQILNRALIPS